MRFRLLDMFCGAGGAAMGYHRAGFDIVGVDHKPQPRFPFDFVRADALEYCRRHGAEFDAIHTSPPCQAYSSLRRLPRTKSNHPRLIAPTRARVVRTGKPYVIENVCGSPLHKPLLLCGTMFGLGVGNGELRRHRLFESNVSLRCDLQCCHRAKAGSRTIGVYGNHGGRRFTVGIWGHSGGQSHRDWTPRVTADEGRAAMGIDWMVWRELTQAIPPAYTEFIGKQLIAALERRP